MRLTRRVLPSLTAEDLKELGVTALGHRRILLDAIAALRVDTGGKAPSADVATTQCHKRASRRPRRAPPSHGDVLRLGGLHGPLGPDGP